VTLALPADVRKPMCVYHSGPAQTRDSDFAATTLVPA
jgi:hypothetical protein